MGGAETEVSAQRRLSRMALSSFLLSLFFCIPLAPLLSGIFGVASLVRMRARPELGGKPLAGIAVALSACTLIGQAAFGWWAWNSFYRSVFLGPDMALRQESPEAFLAEFAAPECQSPPAEAAQFLAALRERYGPFAGASLDRNASPDSPTMGTPRLEGAYVLRFASDTRMATVVLELDPGCEDRLAMRLRSIEVPDDARGTLRFPGGPTP